MLLLRLNQLRFYLIKKTNNKMRKKLLFIGLILFVYSKKGFSQDQVSSEFISKVIQKNGRKFLKNKTIHSVSIGVYKDNQSYTGHFGEIEKGRGNLPTDETLYEIGSVSKTLTGYLVSKAVLEGKIKLEDDVRLYLEGEYSNLEFNGKPIKIKHLLTHTSGLPMFLPLAMDEVFENLNKRVPNLYLELEKSYNKELFLKDLREISITEEPGTVYSYSNAGAELIGYILEVLYQKSMEELLKESFTSQHKMTSTGIRLDSIEKSKLVRGYWMNNETQSPSQFNSLWGTAGGIKMTMMDMMNYAKLQLDNANPIVTESHRVLYEGANSLKVSYFWRVWQDKYGTSYNHHGGTTGTQNWLFIFPKYDLGISIVTNQSGPKIPKLLSKTAGKLLKEIIKN